MYIVFIHIFACGAAAHRGPHDLILGVSRSRSDTPHSVGLLWTNDQPDADPYLTAHNTNSGRSSAPPAEFEPITPASEWSRTHAFDRAAAGTGVTTKCMITVINVLVSKLYV
jgi:hypothetical protein